MYCMCPHVRYIAGFVWCICCPVASSPAQLFRESSTIFDLYKESYGRFTRLLQQSMVIVTGDSLVLLITFSFSVSVNHKNRRSPLAFCVRNVKGGYLALRSPLTFYNNGTSNQLDLTFTSSVYLILYLI